MSTLSIRIDSELKKNAEETLEQMGMTPSGAIRILFKQIVNSGCFPFVPKVDRPNAMLTERLKEDKASYIEADNFDEVLNNIED